MYHRKRSLGDERACVEAGQRLTVAQGRDLLSRYDEETRRVDAAWEQYRAALHDLAAQEQQWRSLVSDLSALFHIRVYQHGQTWACEYAGGLLKRETRQAALMAGIRASLETEQERR